MQPMSQVSSLLNLRLQKPAHTKWDAMSITYATIFRKKFKPLHKHCKSTKHNKIQNKLLLSTVNQLTFPLQAYCGSI